MKKVSNKSPIGSILKKMKNINDVKAVFLFGSVARGEQKPLSDTDICILTNKKIPEKSKAEIASFSSKKLDISLFWDLPPSMRFQIVKEGKILFSRSEELMHIAKVRSVSEYLDFKHILDRNVSRVFGYE